MVTHSLGEEMDKIPMTPHGAHILREELDRLKSEERPRIIKAIAEALEQGDLRENAEFQYAKEEQGFIEGRILEIENKLSIDNQVIRYLTVKYDKLDLEKEYFGSKK